MGVTVSHRIGIQKVRVKKTLDRAENLAIEMQSQAARLGVPFTIRRIDDTTLYVDIGNCETLSFEFNTFEYWQDKAKKCGFCYEDSTLTGCFAHERLATADNEHLQRYPDQRLLWSSAFCKTQFANSLVEHKMVADLIRTVAAFADFVYVNDEGNYYHTGEIHDAAEAIHENGVLIDMIAGIVAGTGYEIAKGGDTVITSRKKKLANDNKRASA